MNCVNPDHYSRHDISYASTDSKRYHTMNGATPEGARVENVFTTKQFGCGTLIPEGSPYSLSYNPTSGNVYPFNGSGAMDFDEARRLKYCFGAYINNKSGSTTTRPFSA